MFVVVMVDFVPCMLFNISIYVFSLQKTNFLDALWGDASVTRSIVFDHLQSDATVCALYMMEELIVES